MKNYHDGDYALNNFSKTSQYKLQIKLVDGTPSYYVSFIDGQDICQETEVSHSVYLEFLRFINVERNLQRWDERHTEQSALTDETLYKRALKPPISLEETALDNLQNEQIQLAAQSLSELQQRRLVLHYKYGLTYEQIAKKEGCRKSAVGESVRLAEEKIRRIIKKSKR